MLWEIELHHKQLSRTVEKKPSGAFHFQIFLQETPVVESFLWSNYRLTFQRSNNITKMTLPRIFRKHSKHLNIWLQIFEVSSFFIEKDTFFDAENLLTCKSFLELNFSWLVSRKFLARDNVLTSMKKGIVHQKSYFTAMQI